MYMGLQVQTIFDVYYIDNQFHILYKRKLSI